MWDPDTKETTLARDIEFNEELPKIPVNSLSEAPTAPDIIGFSQQLDLIDPSNGWWHKLLTYLSREQSDTVKCLVDGDLTGLMEPIYLTADDSAILNEDDSQANE